MLSISIKNAILILLIILIIHFIIKTHIMECDDDGIEKVVIHSAIKKRVVTDDVADDEDVSMRMRSDYDKDSCERKLGVKTHVLNKDNLNELYDFVYEDDETIDEQFEPITPKNKSHMKDIDIACEIDNKKYCPNDYEIKKHAEEKRLQVSKTLKGQPKSVPVFESNNQVLYEYEDEKLMNGGMLKGISAFDMTFNEYENL